MTETSPIGALYRLAAAMGDDGTRLDRFLAAAIAPEVPAMSRSRVKALIEAGQVRAGAETITEPSHRVKPGRVYELRVPPAVDAIPRGQAIPLVVVHEDAQLIVIDKPAGLVVHPAPGNPDRTLVNALIEHCGPSLAGIGGVKRPGIVHRLDKDTSGLIVAAKTDAAHAALVAQFAARSVERSYAAIVWGRPVPAIGTIEGNIGRHPKQRKKMAVLRGGGRAALTRYVVERSLGDLASLLHCRLGSGRTHQIRVHLAHIGHPLVGDPVYGRGAKGLLGTLKPERRAAIESQIALLNRQALHARSLGFTHPASGAFMRFTSALPADLQHLIEAFA
jgi:23S rRNA pseudouridine1911/1915/1917 synthase